MKTASKKGVDVRKKRVTKAKSMPLPEGLVTTLETILRQSNEQKKGIEQQANAQIGNLIVGFLSDKEYNKTLEIKLSDDRKSILFVNPGK